MAGGYFQLVPSILPLSFTRIRSFSILGVDVGTFLLSLTVDIGTSRAMYCTLPSVEVDDQTKKQWIDRTESIDEVSFLF